MDEDKKRKLKNKGWKVGTVQEFLDLDDSEVETIERKVMDHFREKCKGGEEVEICGIYNCNISNCLECGKKIISRTEYPIYLRYQILKGTTAEVQQQVEQYLKEGWKLHGSPFKIGEKMTSGDSRYPLSCSYSYTVGQAMIR